METKLIVAYLALAGSLLTLFFNYLLSLRLKGIEKESAHRLEEIKHRLLQEQEGQKIKDEQLRLTLESFKKAMTALQILKDELLLLRNNYPDAITQADAGSRLGQAVDHLVNVYQEVHPNLKPQPAARLHKAKNLALSLTLEGGVASLAEQRLELTEIQNQLRDTMFFELSERVSPNENSVG